MKRYLKYFGAYLIIMYLVYLITNLLYLYTGIGFIILGLAFFLFFVIYFIRFTNRIFLLKNLHKVVRFILLFILAIIPVYLVFLGFRINSDVCEDRLNELGHKVEKYYLINGKYPESLNDVTSSFSRFIKSPYLLLPLPRYSYKSDSDRQIYSITVYESSVSGYLISSMYKEARYFE